ALARARAVGVREEVLWESGLELRRGRVAHPGAAFGGDFCLAESLPAIVVEATSRQGQHRHETPRLRLEREIPGRSNYRRNGLVAAGPALAQDNRLTGETLYSKRMKRAQLPMANGIRNVQLEVSCTGESHAPLHFPARSPRRDSPQPLSPSASPRPAQDGSPMAQEPGTHPPSHRPLGRRLTPQCAALPR